MFEDFTSFLDILGDPAHRLFQAAWAEFDRRYRLMLLRRIDRMLENKIWVEDAFQDLVNKLLNHDFRILDEFRARDSEVAFRTYLNSIAWSCAQTIKKKNRDKKREELSERLLEEEPGIDLEGMMQTRVELANHLKNQLLKTKKPGDKIDRDILILMLNKFSSLASKDIARMRILNVKPGDIYNIIYRLK